MAKGEMRHKGRVVSVFDGGVKVAVTAEQACASCRMKGACGAGEGDGKILDVYTPDDFAVGEQVEVSITKTMGFRAIFYFYVLPFIIVFFSLVAFVQGGLNEAASGGIALGMVVLYYFLLYLFRDKIAMEVNFEVRKL